MNRSNIQRYHFNFQSKPIIFQDVTFWQTQIPATYDRTPYIEIYPFRFRLTHLFFLYIMKTAPCIYNPLTIGGLQLGKHLKFCNPTSWQYYLFSVGSLIELLKPNRSWDRGKIYGFYNISLRPSIQTQFHLYKIVNIINCTEHI